VEEKTPSAGRKIYRKVATLYAKAQGAQGPPSAGGIYGGFATLTARVQKGCLWQEGLGRQLGWGFSARRAGTLVAPGGPSPGVKRYTPSEFGSSKAPKARSFCVILARHSIKY
jgi:hypothetical protein